MLPSMPLLLFSSSQDQFSNDKFSLPTIKPVISNDIVQSSTEKKVAASEVNINHSVTKDIANSEDDKAKNVDFHELPSLSLNDKILFGAEECDDELVLLAESSPESEKRKQFFQTTSSRKRRKLDLSSSGISENSLNPDERAHHFAESYFMKAKATLDKESFEKFVSTLSDFNEETGSVIDLYRIVMEILKDQPILAGEFVGFLLPHQALQVERFMEYIFYDKAWKFFSKSDAYHLNRIVNALEQHVNNPRPSAESVRNTMLPILKSHPSLAESFFVLFPFEKPVPSVESDIEDMTTYFTGDRTGCESSDWERVVVSTHPDRGCPQSCECHCHSLPPRICTACHLKFSNGQVYVQYGKVMRFVKVSFNGISTEEMQRRLYPAYTQPWVQNKPKQPKGANTGGHQNEKSTHSCPKKREETETEAEIETGTDIVVPAEDLLLPFDEVLVKQEAEDFEYFDLSEGNEDDIIILEDEDEYFEDEEDIEVSSGEGEEKSEDSIPDVSPVKDVLSKDEDKVLDEESRDFDWAATLSKVEDLVFKEESESKSSFETVNEDDNSWHLAPPETMDISLEEVEETVVAMGDEDEKAKEEVEVVTENSLDVTEEVVKECREERIAKEWTREEDKVILEAFQKELDTEHTFSKINCLMPSRTLSDIQGRFQVLMKLLEKVASRSHENYPT